MRITKSAIGLAVLLAIIAVSSAIAGDAPTKIKGEVIQVMQHAGTGNAGELDSVMIRTRQGEQKRLLLGQSGTCEGCVQVGDQIRAQLSAGGSTDGGYQVQTMKVRRTGESLQYRNDAGELLQTQTRSRNQSRDGSAAATQNRAQDRDREPGTGGGHSGANHGGGSHHGGHGGGGGGRR